MGNPKVLLCPHCSFLIPVTGAGSKTIVKVDAPKKAKPKADPTKPTIREVLGDHYDSYWLMANLFGRNKNYQPLDTAVLYMNAIYQGFSPAELHAAALQTTRETSEQKFLPQLKRWLEGQGYSLPPDQGATHGTANRLSARTQAK